VCCSKLQCVAVCCSVLQCVAVCCSVLQCVPVLKALPASSASRFPKNVCTLGFFRLCKSICAYVRVFVCVFMFVFVCVRVYV